MALLIDTDRSVSIHTEHTMATEPTANPTGHTTPGESCDCPGCALHTGMCKAKHLHRYPGTHTTVHLTATDHGRRCPYCLHATTRPGATGRRARAALRRPSATAQQDDLFDPTPYQRPGHRKDQA